MAQTGGLGAPARAGAAKRRQRYREVVKTSSPFERGFWFGAFGAPMARLLCGGATLLFLAFPLADLLGGRLSAAAELAGAGGLAAFAALYLRLFWTLPEATDERSLERSVLLGPSPCSASSSQSRWDTTGTGCSSTSASPRRSRFRSVSQSGGVVAASAAALAIAGGVDSGASLALEALLLGLLVLAVRRLIGLIEELEAAR